MTLRTAANLPMPAVWVLGVPIHNVTVAEACALAEELILGGGVHQFATVNPEFIMAAQRDTAFMETLRRTALNVPDGVGVLWAARRRGVVLRERVPGVELMQALCAMASAHRWRVFFLGAREGVAAKAAGEMALRYPGLVVAGTFAGSPRPDEAMGIVARVRAAQPHLLFVAYGAPAQDKWLAQHLPLIAPDRNEGLIGMGVGGTFDFIAGVQRRAPSWVQQVGLEWLYRLWRQPWRWRRQTVLLSFAWRAMLKSS